jgi:uncharacterized membrane protein
VTPETRRLARYVLPALYGVALIVGIIANAFVIVAVAGAVVLSILYTGIARASGGPGRGRDRQRNRDRDRGRH